MQTLQLITDVKVCSSHSGYRTNRVHGMQASCTAGAKQAADRLGKKLYGDSLVAVVAAPHNLQNDKSEWRLHAEPIYAWAWQSGLIEFGRVVPGGALRVATGLDLQLRARVAVLAREGMVKSEGKLLVPGVPEATDGNAKVDALIAWVDWCAKGNGTPIANGVIFTNRKGAIDANQPH